MGKRVLITGANGAFGMLSAKALLNRGHALVATMRDPDGRNGRSATELRKAGASVVDIDVTDDASVVKGVDAAISAMGGIDVLANVAGTGTHGLTEGFTSEQMLRLFDVNVVGVHRMTRAVLPMLRAQGSGLVINVSSLLGRVSMPFYGPYSATKYAVETLSDSYRVELSQFGVDVVLVEPGGFKTSWIGNLVHPQDEARLDSYGAFAKVPEQALLGYEHFLDSRPKQDVNKVSEAVVNLVEAPAGSRPSRTVVDFLGMGDEVRKMNDQLQQVTTGIYEMFGIEGLLTLKT